MTGNPVQDWSHLDRDTGLGKLLLENCCAVWTGEDCLIEGLPYFSVIYIERRNDLDVFDSIAAKLGVDESGSFRGVPVPIVFDLAAKTRSFLGGLSPPRKDRQAWARENGTARSLRGQQWLGF